MLYTVWTEARFVNHCSPMPYESRKCLTGVQACVSARRAGKARYLAMAILSRQYVSCACCALVFQLWHTTSKSCDGLEARAFGSVAIGCSPPQRASDGSNTSYRH